MTENLTTNAHGIQLQLPIRPLEKVLIHRYYCASLISSHLIAIDYHVMDMDGTRLARVTQSPGPKSILHLVIFHPLPPQTEIQN